MQLIPREGNSRGIVNMSGNNCRSQCKGLRILSLAVLSTTYKQALMWSEQMLHERQIVSPTSLFQEGKGFPIHPVQNPLLGKKNLQCVGDNLRKSSLLIQTATGTGTDCVSTVNTGTWIWTNFCSLTGHILCTPLHTPQAGCSASGFQHLTALFSDLYYLDL